MDKTHGWKRSQEKAQGSKTRLVVHSGTHANTEMEAIMCMQVEDIMKFTRK